MWMNDGISLFWRFCGVRYDVLKNLGCVWELNLLRLKKFVWVWIRVLGGDVGDLRKVGVFVVLEWACGQQAHMNLGKFFHSTFGNGSDLAYISIAMPCGAHKVSAVFGYFSLFSTLIPLGFARLKFLCVLWMQVSMIITEKVGSNLELLWIFEVHWQWAIKKAT